MKNIIFLNKFYAPKIITVLFWVQVVTYILSGLYFLLSTTFIEDKIVGSILLLFGAIFARFISEILAVPFRIYEKVCKIYDKMAADEEKCSVENTVKETAE